VNLFHYLTGHSVTPDVAELLVAPVTMRARLADLIRREISNRREGLPARIVAKMNQLEDPEIVESLCEASAAGVTVELIVRGFCCLCPGVEGRTDNIRVRSIIGRFLEHSRIFHFAAGQENPALGDFFIGSADWMFRNLSKRVEVVTPVWDSKLKARLWEVLDICLRDQRQAWVLGSEGAYRQLRPQTTGEKPDHTAPGIEGTHQTLMRIAQSCCD
jgi:polyphosphate kinase